VRRTGTRGVVLLAVTMAMLGMASVADAAVVGSRPISTWQANGTVRVEVIRGNIVYLGGNFTAMIPAGSTGTGSVTRNGAAAVNLDTGALLNWNPNVTGGAVYAIDTSGSNVYIGGAFSTVGGATHRRLVEVNNSTGAVVTAFHRPGPNAAVRGLKVSGSNLYVGGSFTTMGGASHPYAVRLNATTGALDTAWAPAVDNEVRAFAVDSGNTRVVLGGFFRNLNGQSFIGVGAVNTTTGATVPWAWHTSDLQTFRPFQILRFTQDGNTLFGAGTGNGGSMISWNISTGALNYIAGVNGNVVDMGVLDGILYFGGHFSGYCGLIPGNNGCTVQANRDKLVALDEATGALQTWHPSANTALGVEALAAGDGSVTVGGEFTRIGGVATLHHAQFRE
jgi:trimeric autotransporter adhesin